MALIEMGRGGMDRVKEILKEQFNSQTAVAMFRVTAVDDRENTVSYRTKLIHVIFTGPQTPVMKRAKIASFNAAFKQPFSFNLSIQTDDVDGDLNESSIERSLRASGGAHQPTRYDFSNSAAPGETVAKSKKSPRASDGTNPSASPAPAHTSSSEGGSTPVPMVENFATPLEVMERHAITFDNRDLDGLVADYAEDCQLIHFEGNHMRTVAFVGKEEIRGYYQQFFVLIGDSDVNVRVNEINGNTSRLEFDIPEVGLSYGMDVFYIQNGKIVLQTVVTHIVMERRLSEEEYLAEEAGHAAVEVLNELGEPEEGEVQGEEQEEVGEELQPDEQPHGETQNYEEGQNFENFEEEYHEDYEEGQNFEEGHNFEEEHHEEQYHDEGHHDQQHYDEAHHEQQHHDEGHHEQQHQEQYHEEETQQQGEDEVLVEEPEHQED